jgi:hypothetical protein
MLRDKDLTLIRLDGREFRQQLARKGVRCNDDTTCRNCSAVGDDLVLVRMSGDNVKYLGPRVESDAVA